MADVTEAMEEPDTPSRIWSDNDGHLEEAHSSNHLSVSGIHRRIHRARRTEAIASSQPGSGNYLGMDMGHEDELHSTSGTNIDGEELQIESDLVPRVGMEFASEVAVYDFYCSYAKQTGFNVSRGKTEYSASDATVVKAKQFLCSCQGHNSKVLIAKAAQYKRQVTKRCCDAKIECLVDDGTWKISKVVLEHNHVMTALSVARIPDEIRVVGEESLASYADRSTDVSQVMRKNRSTPEPEETQDLIDRFECLARLDCCYCYSLRVLEPRGMESFFWRDSRSKVDYEHFSDLLVLDTRTWIAKYDMVVATFWGLNHHRQPTIFGHGLLIDRTVGSFHWLLNSFLESMNRQKPQTIVTEVSDEISEAISLVLPKTRHCLPALSILNSFRKHLSPLSDQLDVVNHFRECIFVQSQEEFESKWNSFIGKYKLHDNLWLASLYKMHDKWSHAFMKNVFLVGLHSTQHAGYMVRIPPSETWTLTEIQSRCEVVAKKMREEEHREDVLCEKNTVNLKTQSPMEKEAERLYTPTIYKMFLQEFINILGLGIEEIKGKEFVRMFQLTLNFSRRNAHTVRFDPSNSTLACSCAKFDSVGILCVHALKVLNFMNTFKIPSRYVLKRWTKSAKDGLPGDTPSARTACKGVPNDSFTGEFIRKALQVAHMSVNKKRKRIAMRFMNSALENIAKVQKTEAVADGLDDLDSRDDRDQSVNNEYALETQLDQEKEENSYEVHGFGTGEHREGPETKAVAYGLKDLDSREYREIRLFIKNALETQLDQENVS